MGALFQLSSLALQGAARAAGEVAGLAVVGKAGEAVVGTLLQRFSDHSQKLTEALTRASRSAWRAVEISLAGRSWWDQCKLTLATGDERAIRSQVDAFLHANPLDGVAGHGPDFRAQCLAQLQAARKAGLLDRDRLDPGELAHRVGDLSRFGDQAATVQAEFAVLDDIASGLRRTGYDALATFLALRPASGPPLLLASMRYFFQREIEKDQELFQGLAYARLESLATGQQAGFAGLEQALTRHGEQLESLLADVQSVVTRTHAEVLDMKGELSRQGQQMQQLGQAILAALQQHQLEKRELHAGDSLSVRDDEERRLVRDLIKRYRAVPAADRRSMPALLNAVGKLEVVTGNFESAEKDFRELGTLVADPAARAEAAHNAYRAALERRAWTEALGALKEAIVHDGKRFAPFPVDKYEPEKILGAGGFGVAFLCRNRHSSGRVVIKTLLRDTLDRDLGEVFREAQTLEDLEHPAIIRIRDCDYADPKGARPYFVMDYFQGQTLGDYIEQYGQLTHQEFLPLARLVASGLEKAHARGILHRDIKPANLLVRREPTGWQAKLIDFGLALRAQSTSSTMKQSLDRTLAGTSIAGTLEYAAPEQMGKLKGVAVGTYSDVYGFGKTCCFALFGTAQPTFQHWQELPRPLADLLGRCLSEQPRQRPQSFVDVLRELDRVEKATTVVPIMAALPVEVLPEVVPVLEPVRESSRRTRPPEREPEPARSSSRSRRAEYSDRDERRERERPEPPRRRSSRGSFVSILVGFLVLAGLASFAWFWLFGSTSPGIFSARPRPQAFVDPAEVMGVQGRPGVVGTRGAAVTQPPPPVVKIDPYKPDDFPKLLEELKKKPQLKRVAEMATRLAVTEPTEKQKSHHRQLLQMRDLQGKQAATRKKLEEFESHDDITQIARGMNPLLDSNDLNNKKAAVKALMNWATPENTDLLLENLQAGGFGADEVRINSARVLASLKDPRGVRPVVKRLTDPWDGGRGIKDAIIAYGPMAEDEVLKYIPETGEISVHDAGTIKAACSVLAQIGTTKSLPALKNAAKNFFTKGEATAALTAVESRINNRASKK